MDEVKMAAVPDRTHTVVVGKEEVVFAGSSRLVAQCLYEVTVAEAVATMAVRVVMNRLLPTRLMATRRRLSKQRR